MKNKLEFVATCWYRPQLGKSRERGLNYYYYSSLKLFLNTLGITDPQIHHHQQDHIKILYDTEANGLTLLWFSRRRHSDWWSWHSQHTCWTHTLLSLLCHQCQNNSILQQLRVHGPKSWDWQLFLQPSDYMLLFTVPTYREMPNWVHLGHHNRSRRLIWSICFVFFYFALFILIDWSGIFEWYICCQHQVNRSQ